MWFLGINPDESLPDPSLLCKFRKQRLRETTVDDIIQEVVKQCIDKGLIKGTGISLDCTHTSANTVKKVPERIMKHLAKKIIKSLESENGTIPDSVDTNIPNYKEIESHTEAKATMKNYLEKLIESVENIVDSSTTPKTKQSLEKAKQILSDPKFIPQKGVRSLVDEDARVGYKSRTDSFFRYKVEFAMVTDERIITAVEVQDGAYVDGTEFNNLFERTKGCGLNLTDGYGDKAYFRKHILDTLKENNIDAIIPVSESAYRIDESKYQYNKDSNQWFCDYGNYTIHKKKATRKNGQQVLEYRFDKEICRNCPGRQGCINSKRIGKILILGVNTPEFYEYSQRAKTPEFIEKYKNRASQEWKNGEMKRFHGMDRARGYGLRSMRIQAKLTALAVNLKRIAALASSFSVKLLSFPKTKVIIDSI